MTCGKRANPKALDSLERATVRDLLRLVRVQPEFRALWEKQYASSRKRAALCSVLSSTPTTFFAFKGEGELMLKDIKRTHLIRPDRLVYVRTGTPLEDIHEHIWKIQKLAGLYDKDSFEVIMYNGFSDTFAIVSEGHARGRQQLVEFKLEGKNEYRVIKSSPLRYSVKRSPDVQVPRGYIRLYT